LTTAASIWIVASIGAACGLGYYPIAGTTVALALAVLFLLGFIESRLFPDSQEKD
jgi:putative Mg2+ transporter-C (MgtC) family protein